MRRGVMMPYDVFYFLQCNVRDLQRNWEKSPLEVDQDESSEATDVPRILDTGEGVSIHEMDNLHFPFIVWSQNDRYGRRTRWHSG